ncbi:hypothetical protein LIER_41441 [Lithospermum erythrorhizon]|uniref:Integrase catalytic domain-containing protein n=1 Tax=Lithospermum erythrorhizon TaxID=34254 RepID=A0AAV3RAL0_LITER
MNNQPVRSSFAALRPLLLSEEDRVNKSSKSSSPDPAMLLCSATANKAPENSFRTYSNTNTGSKFKGKFSKPKYPQSSSYGQSNNNFFKYQDKSAGILGQAPFMPPPIKPSAKCQICGMYNHEAIDSNDRFNHAYTSNKLHKSLTAMYIDEASDTVWYPDSGASAHMTGKHVKQPFASANEMFDLIFSDVWESPVLSPTGIKYSSPTTPQQNGVGERKHRHLAEKIRCLLFQSQLPPTFWVEALNYVVYLINKLPSPSLSNKSPYQILFQTQPDYAMIKIFGCLFYPHLTKQIQSKYSPRSLPCIFLGISATHKGYRCYNPEAKRVFVSRHVRFSEDVFPYLSFHSIFTLCSLSL